MIYGGFFMIILRKKHFVLILLCLLLSFSFCLVSEKNSSRNFLITQVSALPVDEKVIVIDAGHRSEKMVAL